MKHKDVEIRLLLNDDIGISYKIDENVINTILAAKVREKCVSDHGTSQYCECIRAEALMPLLKFGAGQDINAVYLVGVSLEPIYVKYNSHMLDFLSRKKAPKLRR